MSLYVETAGSGPAVVFTHDGLLHSESWDAQFAAFAIDYRVARWDRRGFGRSPWPTEPYSSVDDLASVLRSLSDAPATLIGCSFGSLVTVHCALEHPELVARLVLVGPIVSGLPLSEHFTTRGGLPLPAPDALVADHIAYWSETDPWFVAPDNTAARQRLRALLTANPQNLHPPLELERLTHEPALPRLSEIAARTLIVAGASDVPDVHAHAGALQAGIPPNAHRMVLSGSGHVPHLEIPGVFNRVVLEFLIEYR